MNHFSDTAIERSQPPMHRAERVSTALPVKHGVSVSTTQNISATGVLFSTQETAELGSTVSFTVEVEVDGKRLNLVCEGQVVRVERQNGRTHVAARLSDSFFEAV